MHDKENLEVDRDRFMEWLESSDKIGEVKNKGAKILICSPFEADNSFKCGIFPERGRDKDGNPSGRGRFHDFKSGRAGNLFDFVMAVDDCGFGEAVKKVGAKGGWRPKRENRNDYQDQKARIVSIDSLACDLKWPRGLKDLDPGSSDPEIVAAAEYMMKRGVDLKRFEMYYCSKDHPTGWPDKRFTQRLRGRVLIPYWGPDGGAIYWSARAMSKRQEPKYLEPHPSDGPVKKEAVLYCPNWASVKGKNVMLVEGAIDAISLWSCGLPAISTQGSVLYDDQVSVMKLLNITPVFAYDRDKAGRRGVLDGAKQFAHKGFFVFPPDKIGSGEKGHDWNSYFVECGRQAVKDYVMAKVAQLTDQALFMIKRSVA